MPPLPNIPLIVHCLLFIVNYKAHSALFNPVRLACVRHAASVRPEPGSNSLLNSIPNTVFTTVLFNYQSAISLASFSQILCPCQSSYINIPQLLHQLIANRQLTSALAGVSLFVTLFNLQCAI